MSQPSENTVLQQLTLAGIPCEPKTKGWLGKIRAYQRDSREQDGLITKAQAAALLELSNTRVHQLVSEGLLDEFAHFGKTLISARQAEAVYRANRTGGAEGRLITSALRATLKG